MFASPLTFGTNTYDRKSSASDEWLKSDNTVTDKHTMQIKSTTTGKTGSRVRRTLLKVFREQPDSSGVIEAFTVNLTIVGNADGTVIDTAERTAVIAQIASFLGVAGNVTKLINGEG